MVLLLFQGTSSGACMRIDLPPVHDGSARSAAGTEQFCEHVLELAMRLDGVTGVAVVVFVDGRVTGPPHGALLTTLALAAHRHGIELHAPSYRAANGWGQYDLGDGRASTTPQPLHLLTETGEWPVLAPERVDLARGREAPALDPGAPRVSPGEDVLATLERVLSSTDAGLNPDDFAAFQETLTACLSDPAMRDAVLATIAFGPDDPADLLSVVLELIADSPIGLDDVEQFGGGDSLRHRFEHERCVAAIALFRSFARSLGVRDRASIHASLAWLYWAIGQSTQAAAWAERALAADDLLSIPGAVDLLIANGIVPSWFGVPPASVRARWAQHERADAARPAKARARRRPGTDAA